jgi:hypothetical protein
MQGNARIAGLWAAGCFERTPQAPGRIGQARC